MWTDRYHAIFLSRESRPSLPLPDRPILLVLVVAVAITTGWLLHSGHWRTLAAQLPFVSSAVSEPDAGKAAADQASSRKEPVYPANAIRTWRDENGVTHFADNGAAPDDASVYTPRKPSTLADHVDELESGDVSMEAIYRASKERAEREAREARESGGTPAAEEAAQPAADNR